MTRLLAKKEYKTSKGTTHTMLTEDDKANQARAEEVSIKEVIRKYGIMPNEMLNSAKENLYLDNTNEDMSLNERIELRRKTDKYFKTLPANVRKEFKDNNELFYEQILTGNFETHKKTGVFSQEQIDNFNYQRNLKTAELNSLKEQAKLMDERIKNYEKQIADLQKNNEIHTNTANAN